MTDSHDRTRSEDSPDWEEPSIHVLPFASQSSRYPDSDRRMRHVETGMLLVGLVAVVVRYGLRPVSGHPHWELGFAAWVCMLGMTIGLVMRHRWSLATVSFVRDHRGSIIISALWVVGQVVILIIGPELVVLTDGQLTRGPALIEWTELLVVVRAAYSAIHATHRLAAGETNPAMLLVLSFLLLIAVGTGLLMLPGARRQVAGEPPRSAPFTVALFTATSASCVTGLAVVSTGLYWSRTGQTIILALFQIGGLGIMTCGAFFALGATSSMPMRHRATLSDLLDSEGLHTTRQLLRAILLFTLTFELAGALCLSNLWPDAPWHERAFQSVFHAVSAFCNAGFTTIHDGQGDVGFAGMGTRWEVWGPVTVLIVTGGLGFNVMYNLALLISAQFHTLKRRPLFGLSQRRVRLSLASKLTLVSAVILLVGGAMLFFLLESTGPPSGDRLGKRIGDAWFQSVTFRTAGFNTVDHSELQTATKLFAILLMFIGASPGSTGGGVKTISLAIAVLTVISILRGRRHVECFGRTIVDAQVNRALIIIAIGVLLVMFATFLLVLFEQQPDRFLDHLFEATSAFATVGVSTGVTSELSTASQLVIVTTMFLGRVGPLTLLIALARDASSQRYSYPVERVPLG